jgi:hypothetical protein
MPRAFRIVGAIWRVSTSSLKTRDRSAGCATSNATIAVIMGEAAMFRELGATRVDQPGPGNGDIVGRPAVLEGAAIEARQFVSIQQLVDAELGRLALKVGTGSQILRPLRARSEPHQTDVVGGELPNPRRVMGPPAKSRSRTERTLGLSRSLGAARLRHAGDGDMSARREAINASGALNRPRRSSGGTTASTASSFSVDPCADTRATVDEDGHYCFDVTP